MRRVAAAAVVVLAAGCGGGNDRLSEQELRRQANAICADYDRKIDELGEPASVEEVEEFAVKAADLTRRGVADLRGLRPPEDLERDYDRLLAEADTVLALSERLEKAARDRDSEELQKILREAQASDRRSDRIARRLGLTKCAES